MRPPSASWGKSLRNSRQRWACCSVRQHKSIHFFAKLSRAFYAYVHTSLYACYATITPWKVVDAERGVPGGTAHPHQKHLLPFPDSTRGDDQKGRSDAKQGENHHISEDEAGRALKRQCTNISDPIAPAELAGNTTLTFLSCLNIDWVPKGADLFTICSAYADLWFSFFVCAKLNIESLA